MLVLVLVLVLGATIVTVPCAAQTAAPSLTMSIRATPLRLVRATISATATQMPDETGRRRLSLNSVVAAQAHEGVRPAAADDAVVGACAVDGVGAVRSDTLGHVLVSRSCRRLGAQKDREKTWFLRFSFVSIAERR